MRSRSWFLLRARRVKRVKPGYSFSYEMERYSRVTYEYSPSTASTADAGKQRG